LALPAAFIDADSLPVEVCVTDVPIVSAVIGLDLSLTATGVCLTDGSTMTIMPSAASDARLALIRDEVVLIAKGAHLAVLEDLPTHARMAGISGMVQGAVRVALQDLGVPYVTVPPATLKKYATGSGVATKTAMAIAALKRCSREFANDNECDAFWLRAMGMDALGWKLADLPQNQREQLTRVSWPWLA
jgi:Holliday junction resolvasome RuvABC endonuclease subunit